MKFLHAADIHLDSPLHGLQRYEGAPVEELRGATRRAFDNLIQLAIDEQVAFVLIAGDLYDGDWKDYNTGLYLVERLGRLRRAGIRVFIIAGNHDAASQITKHLRLPENVTLLRTAKPQQALLEEFAVAIVGQGFANRAVTADLSAGYPQGDPSLFTIGLLHTCLDGKPGHELYAPCSVDGLRAKGYQYWALGHVHQREVVSREPWIVFPGNTQGRHIRETGPKGCTLVTVEDGEVDTVEHRDLDVLRWAVCEVDIGDSANVDEVYLRVGEALQQSLDAADGRPLAVRLQLHGSSAAHAELQARREHWLQEFRALASGLNGEGGAAIWLEKLRLETRSPVAADDLAARDDALSGLLNTIRELELDDAALTELGAEVAALDHKLPVELRSGADPYQPLDPTALRSTLEDVKELLAVRLLSGEPPG